MTAPKLGEGDPSLGNVNDAFVVKLDPSQSGAASLVDSTYLGGTSVDAGYGIAVDSCGNAYVIGETVSTNFPIEPNPGAFDTTCGIDGNCTGGLDAFVTKLGNPHANFCHAPFAYITHVGDDIVSVINTGSHTVIDTVQIGDTSWGVAVHPDGTRAYVTDGIGDTLFVINTATNTVIDTVQVGLNPIGVAVHPSGAWVYVANSGVDPVLPPIHTISVISTATNTVVDTVELDVVTEANVPFGIAVSPDGTKVYVANSGSGTVSVIDTTNMVTDTVSLGLVAAGQPYGVAVHPDGTKVYVTDSGSDSMHVIDTTTFPGTVVDTELVGNGPRGVAVIPNGSFVYVANVFDDTVSVIETVNNSALPNPVPVGNQPVAFGKFIGPADRDGDGITDPVDFDQNGINDESTVFSDNFSDKQLGGTSSGFIVDRADLIVSVWDAFNPDGLWVRASGGGIGAAEVNACGLSGNVQLTDGDLGLITCSSLKLQVVVGPIEIGLGADTFLSIPTGGIVKVTESNGQFTIENLGSVTVTIVDSGGNPTASIGPGESFPPTADNCPDDPDKTEPGACGCGVADTDSDGDGTADCNDGCPNDSTKTAPGVCGCGVADTDSDGDGAADCNDGCPADPAKTVPGVCGCGVADTDSDGDSILDCNDSCPTVSGTGPDGCPVVTPPTDSDGDGLPDNEDTCPNSDLSAKVVIEGCDTGVDNDLTANGCTISDLVAGCEEGATDHGQYVSCVAQVTNDLKKAGTITGKEKGAIQSCAAQADIP